MKKSRIFLTLGIVGAFVGALASCGDSINNGNIPTIPTDEQYVIYELAKDSGFNGSYEEWLNSIKGDFIELRVNDNSIEWKYSQDSSWRKLVSLKDLAGADGREIEFNVNETHIQWRYKGDNSWKDLIALSTLTGAKGQDGTDGREVEFNVNETHIQWRYKGEESWTDLITLSSLIGAKGQDGTNGTNGEDGREVEFNVNQTHIQWRYKGEESWTNLVDLSLLKGKDGTNGDSAYDIAVKLGFKGTVEEWIASLKGEAGENGKSAYEIYKILHPEYTGSEEDWINDFISGELDIKNNYKNIEYIPEMSIRASRGQAIDLPKQALVYLKDGGYEWLDVEWLNIKDLTSDFLGFKEIYGIINKYNVRVKCNLRVESYTTTDLVVNGYVNGILENDDVIVTLYNDNYVKTFKAYNNGYFCFNGLAEGEYTLKVDAKGYELADIIKVKVSKVGVDPNSIYSNVSHVSINLVSYREDGYYYTWEKLFNDNNETSANVNTPNNIEFVGDPVLVSDIGQASFLREKYNLTLVNDKLHWSTETIARFYELYKSLPEEVTSDLKSVWSLVDYEIQDDIEFELVEGVYKVRVANSAIANATPRVALVNGQKGRYFSKRLYNAIIRFVTDGGRNAAKCEKILNVNFLTSFNVPDYVELTRGITDEDETQFQEFLPEEKLQILTMFEEMPEGMHKMKELKYLIRRKTGQTHPIYPEAAAVTWTTANQPYIEFMDVTFNDDAGYYHTKRLIIHEKTHMFWEYYFSDELKKQWCELGGWYKNPEDASGWSTTKQTEFVSAYAHAKNPNEDMAESVATYVINPDLLKSRSINKYNFIKNYIMNGSIYLTQIRDDLTFEVYNLNPDYVYPGQVKKIDVKVKGGSFEDKRVTFEMELFDNGKFSGAENIFFRLSPTVKSTQLYDVQLNKINEEGTKFRGEYVISKYSYSGYWYTDQIRIVDSVGNERYESNVDYSMKVLIDNPLYDNKAPELVRNTLKLSLENANNREHPTAQNLVVEYDYKENVRLKDTLVRLYCKDSLNDSLDIYAKEEEIDHVNQRVKMKIYIPEHYCSGIYEVSEISFTDVAKNHNYYHVDYGQLVDENNTIEIINSNPDTKDPVLDVNNIKISAVPSNPDSPNGETFVTLKLTISDDISGFVIGSVRLLDPQGINHFYWIYTPYRHNDYYFEGDPTKPVEYTFKITLPRGSAPGTWGIYEIALSDFALNTGVYNFTEIVHFDVIK